MLASFRADLERMYSLFFLCGIRLIYVAQTVISGDFSFYFLQRESFLNDNCNDQLRAGLCYVAFNYV